jgi:hypothetical protein
LNKKIAALLVGLKLKKWTLIWDDEWHAHYELKWFWYTRNRSKENGRKVENLPPL